MADFSGTHDILSTISSFDLNLSNPWSVNGVTLNSADIASSLFIVSLLPYLVLLYFLNRSQTTPSLSNNGFRFLLLFVFATIPAGIYAKVQYHDILANIDWLHGGAESLLTITNLLIVFGFRNERKKFAYTNTSSSSPSSSTTNLFDASIPILLFSSVLLFGIESSSTFSSLLIPTPSHVEPTNALSIPTWMIHISSVSEWLIAMSYIWEHAEVSGNPRWKGLPWGMLPSHISGTCACTFHFFYNNPAIYWIVAIQALFTVIGNSTMALAAYRIFKYGTSNTDETKGDMSTSSSFMSSSGKSLADTDFQFASKLIIISFFGSLLVKYGELYSDIPFEATPTVPVLAILGLSTALVTGALAYRSITTTDNNQIITNIDVDRTQF